MASTVDLKNGIRIEKPKGQRKYYSVRINANDHKRWALFTSEPARSIPYPRVLGGANESYAGVLLRQEDFALSLI